MKIVAISDTHGYHAKVTIPECDVLVHAGDWSADESVSDAIDFLRWLDKQPAKRIVFIAGNHDLITERNEAWFRNTTPEFCERASYLQDTSVIIDGIKFHGSPVTPRFYDWAWNRDRGDDIRKHWDLIPTDTDVLVTHGPPAGILDKTQKKYFGERVGCLDLYESVLRVTPSVHIFGHIHPGYGTHVMVHNNGKKTQLFNCSFVSNAVIPENKPWIINL